MYINVDDLNYNMNKELKILKIMKSEKCCWEEAVEKAKERKSLKEFL